MALVYIRSLLQQSLHNMLKHTCTGISKTGYLARKKLTKKKPHLISEIHK